MLTARTAEAARAAATTLRDEGLDVLDHACDVSSGESVDALFARLDEELGRVDVLVSNAGTIFESSGDSALDIDVGVVAKAIDNNALGALRMGQHALRRMNRERLRPRRSRIERHGRAHRHGRRGGPRTASRRSRSTA